MRRRALLAVLAVLASAMAGAGAVRGAEPSQAPTLGATLGANRDVVVVDSTASVAATVTLSTPPGWQLAETTFRVEPGEHHVVKITRAGDDGQIVAVMQAIDAPAGTDRSALVLALGTPRPPASSPPWWLLLVVLPVLYIIRRAQSRPWRVRRGPK
jgi:hypothetical protein